MRKSQIPFMILALVVSNFALTTTHAATIVNYVDVVNPEPDLQIPGTHNYSHDLTAYGFNPTTDTIISADINIWFSEAVDNAADDSVTIYFDGIFAGNAFDPGTLGISSWDFIQSVNISYLQDDGILNVTLQAGSNTLFQQSTLNASASVVPVPPAIWLFGSGIIGLIGLARRKVLV